MLKKRLSVLTVTNRKGGTDILEKCLKRQTFKDFEWIIQTDEDIDNPGKFWNLNRAYNKGISKCHGDIIVSIQDLIWIPPDGLEKFAYNTTDNICVTGAGDIYEGSPEGPMVWNDPRKRTDLGSYYECNPNDWELNYCSAPRKAFYEIGGFDEKMDDLGYGMDNVAVALRLDNAGYKFFIDQTNECKGVKHGRPSGWDKHHLMHGGYQTRMRELIDNNRYKKLEYLQDIMSEKEDAKA